MNSSRAISHSDGLEPFYWLKYFLTKIGSRISSRTIYGLDTATDYLEAGRWLREHQLEPPHRWRRREDLFDFIARPIADRAVLYLEFGVYQGDSLRYWSQLLHNPSSHLHGFDSFEGLPEDYTANLGRGHFSTGGRLPQVDDPRVKLFKGWFKDTLPNYVPPPHELLVINIDCDLYSSTAYVFERLGALMAPGTYLYFDEFIHRRHELLAFDELIKQNGMRFEVVGATRTLARIAFRRTA